MARRRFEEPASNGPGGGAVAPIPHTDTLSSWLHPSTWPRMHELPTKPMELPVASDGEGRPEAPLIASVRLGGGVEVGAAVDVVVAELGRAVGQRRRRGDGGAVDQGLPVGVHG